MAILPQPGIITLPILLLSKLDRFTSSMAMGGTLNPASFCAYRHSTAIWKNQKPQKNGENLERAMRFELTTLTLAR